MFVKNQYKNIVIFIFNIKKKIYRFNSLCSLWNFMQFTMARIWNVCKFFDMRLLFCCVFNACQIFKSVRPSVRHFEFEHFPLLLVIIEYFLGFFNWPHLCPSDRLNIKIWQVTSVFFTISISKHCRHRLIC